MISMPFYLIRGYTCCLSFLFSLMGIESGKIFILKYSYSLKMYLICLFYLYLSVYGIVCSIAKGFNFSDLQGIQADTC